MAANRFDTSQQQQYVSSYVPLPFEAISNLGAKMTKDHELKQTEADALAEAINKIKVTNEVISEGAGDDLGIKSRKIGYGDFKNEVYNKYTQANKQLTDDYYAGKLNPNEFNQKVNQLKSQFSSDYQKLKFAEANSIAIEEANKKYREAEQAGANSFILNKLAEEGRRLLDNPYEVQYQGAPIGKVADLEDLKNKYASNFKEQILSSGAGIRDEKTGYITWRDKSGVTKQRIVKSVENTFDQDPILGSQTREQTFRFLRDRGLDWNSEVTLQDGTKVKAGDYYYNSLKQDFIDGVVAKAESSEQKTDRKKDFIFEETRKAAAEEENIKRALSGQPIESQTFKNFLEKDPKYKELEDSGVFNKTAEGIKIDWNKLSTRDPIYDIVDVNGRKVSTIVGYKESDTKRSQLVSLMKEMAESINYNKPFKADNYQDIVNQYNVNNKVRLFDEQMAAPVSKIETAKAERNWNNYDVMSPEDPTNPLPNEKKPVFSKAAGDQLVLNNWRTTANGKMNRDGYIKRKDGTIEPIIVRPKALIDDGYHNNVAELNLIGVKYETGQLKGKPTEDGLSESLDVKIIPGVGTVQVLGVKNAAENNKKTAVYKFFPTDNNGNLIGQPILYKTQADFQKAMNLKYYGTEAGYSDRQSIANAKQTYESTEVPSEDESSNND